MEMIQPQLGAPTAAAIDGAISRALEFNSGHKDAEDRSADSRGSETDNAVEEVFGKRGSYERGFVLSAGIIVALLLIGRALLGPTPMLGILVPAIVLSGAIGNCFRRKTLPSDNRRASTLGKCWTMGILCGPLLAILARHSLSRTESAALATSWLATAIGTLAATLPFV